MICYMDKTFCSFYKECKKGNECHRALIPEVLEDAKRWSGIDESMVCQYVDKPKCFELNNK